MGKSKRMVIGIVAATLAAGGWLYAERGAGGPGPGGGFDPQQRQERRLGHLKEALNLTADQETKIREAMRQQHEKIRAIREEMHQKIASLLTAEQKQKFEQMKKERQEHKKKG